MRRWLPRLATWAFVSIAAASTTAWVVSLDRSLTVDGPIASGWYAGVMLDRGDLGSAALRMPLGLSPNPWEAKVGDPRKDPPMAATVEHQFARFGWSRSPAGMAGGVVVVPLWAPLVAAVAAAYAVRRFTRPRLAAGFAVLPPAR